MFRLGCRFFRLIAIEQTADEVVKETVTRSRFFFFYSNRARRNYYRQPLNGRSENVRAFNSKEVIEVTSYYDALNSFHRQNALNPLSTAAQLMYLHLLHINNGLGNGTLVYGDLIHFCGEIYIDNWEVKPESVAQLVGCDKDGNEIYEGDIFIDAQGDEFEAILFDNIVGGCTLKKI